MMDRIKESAAPHCFFFPGGMRLVCCPAVSPAEYFGVVERFSVFAATGFNAALGLHLFCSKLKTA